MKERFRRLPLESRWVCAILLLACTLSIAAFVAGTCLGVPVLQVYASYVGIIWLLALATVALALVPVTAQAVASRQNPLTRSEPFLRDRFGSVDRTIGTLGPILLMPIVMGGFGTLKQMIPLFAPFKWDDTLAEAGRMLFFGVRPWRLTHAVFGSPEATLVLDRIYSAWVPMLFVTVIAFAMLAPLYLRARFFVAFSAAWLLLGVIGAFLFSSAGPCYAGAINASAAPDFAPLMAHLRAIDAQDYSLAAVHWQDQLWQAHVDRRYGFAMGVSAMPSMHNAIAFLYVLSAARARPVIRVGAWLFAAAVWIGSVHLGWHYAVDGLFAWAAMAAIWWAAGVYLRWAGYPLQDPVNDVEQAHSDGPASPIPGVVAA